MVSLMKRVENTHLLGADYGIGQTKYVPLLGAEDPWVNATIRGLSLRNFDNDVLSRHVKELAEKYVYTGKCNEEW